MNLTIAPSPRNRWSMPADRPGRGAVSVPHLRLVRDAEPRPESAGPGVVADAPIRLTRRGRVVVRLAVAVAGLIAVAAAVLLIGRTAQAGPVAHPVPVTYRVVLPGQTLWQIAGEVAPSTDRRDTVAEIVDLNALPSADVQIGQRIAVPAHT